MEKLIRITENKVLGMLPDPFVFDSGERVKNTEDWGERRKEIYKTAVELQYGTIPPEPELLEIEKSYDFSNQRTFRITTGTKKCPVSFTMQLFLPDGDGPFPAVVDGDLCFNYVFDKEFINEFVSNGIMLVMFNRTELMPDTVFDPDRYIGQLHKAYPEYTFGAIGAWAWGYSRCVDALEKIGLADMNCIAFTGHSRGGKTAALAGVLDERAAIVNPNETCAGACSCYRSVIKAITQDGEEMRSETLEDMNGTFPTWLGEGMHEYNGRAQELPFDCHFLKAMVAPRKLFISEAASDIWSNPVGSWQTTMAAKQVFKFLGVEDNLFWYYRDGYHSHDIRDVKKLVNIILNHLGKAELEEGFFETPFEEPPLMFDWNVPE